MVTTREIKTVFKILEAEHQPTMLEQLSAYTPFQMLVATLLSSRTKDRTTIPLVKKLFQKYSTPKDFLKISTEELEKALYGIGFYKVKAQNIKKLSEIILEKYQNKVPERFEELITLPSVGRKTVNCILSYVFHQPSIAVDTHVQRISNRLGWVKTKTPKETEEAWQKIIPKELWNKVNMLFVDYGQRICRPINPKCRECKIRIYCEGGKNLNI